LEVAFLEQGESSGSLDSDRCFVSANPVWRPKGMTPKTYHRPRPTAPLGRVNPLEVTVTRGATIERFVRAPNDEVLETILQRITSRFRLQMKRRRDGSQLTTERTSIFFQSKSQPKEAGLRYSEKKYGSKHYLDDTGRGLGRKTGFYAA
jgi:hypothetical protein